MSPASSEMLIVQICDAVQHAHERGILNINGNGVIPVAILGSQALNVSNINTGSLGFNGLQVRVKPNNQNQCSTQDVNGDGIPAWSANFKTTPETGLKAPQSAL